jgi:hypothetical protein
MTKLENIINANDNKGRDYFVAPKEQAEICESLRQKNSCLTQLWRALLHLCSHQRGKPNSVNFQVQGQRPSYVTGEVSVLFYVFKLKGDLG